MPSSENSPRKLAQNLPKIPQSVINQKNQKLGNWQNSQIANSISPSISANKNEQSQVELFSVKNLPAQNEKNNSSQRNFIDKIAQSFQSILNNSFLKDSGGIFVVSIIVAVFNYLLIIYANRILKTEYELWNTLASLTVILAAPIAGFSMEIMKKTAKLSKINPESAFAYYYFLRNKISQIVGVFLLISPILILPLQMYLLHPSRFWDFGSWMSFWGMESLVIFLTLTQAILSFLFNINQYFFLGKMDLVKYATVAAGSIILRFLLSVFFLQSNLGILSLPLGIILSGTIFFVIVELWLNRENSHLIVPPNLHFDLREEIKLIAKSALVGFFLTAYFDLSSVLSRNFFIEKSFEANLFATINIFGKITYFGTTAMLGGLIVHAISDVNQKTYKMALLMITVVSLGAAFVLYLLSPFILITVLGRPEFLPFNNLIFLVVGYVGFYTVIFASVNYSIARNQYFLANLVIFLTILFWAVLNLLNFGFVNSFFASFGFSAIQKVLWTNLLMAIFGAILYILAIIFGQKLTFKQKLFKTK